MVPVKHHREMGSVVTGTKMALTEEDMAILYAGPDLGEIAHA